MDDNGRRANPRIKAKLKVRFKDANAFISEYTHNISKGGLFVRTKKPCAASSMVEVIIILPESEREVSAIGQVIHVVNPEEATEKQPAGMGLELQKLSDEGQQAIDEFIEAHLAKASGADRRKHKRYDAKIRVRFGSVEALREEYSHNISHGGIYIKTEKPKNLRERVMVILTHPDSGNEVKLEGEVVRVVDKEKAESSGQPPGMGILFLNLDEETREKLDAFIQ